MSSGCLLEAIYLLDSENVFCVENLLESRRRLPRRHAEDTSEDTRNIFCMEHLLECRRRLPRRHAEDTLEDTRNALPMRTHAINVSGWNVYLPDPKDVYTEDT